MTFYKIEQDDCFIIQMITNDITMITKHIFIAGKIQTMRMMCYSVMTQAYSEKEIPSSPNRSRTYDLPITSSDSDNGYFATFLADTQNYIRIRGWMSVDYGRQDKYSMYHGHISAVLQCV